MAGTDSRHANQRNDEEMRIVMVGKTGIGKSATGNTILGHHHFDSRFSARSLTEECCKRKTRVDGQKVAVIDTPGLFDTRYDQEKTKRDICQCISYSSPGPHIFLVVIRLGRFTEEEKQTVQTIQEIFGQAADKYSMVLFTHGDLLTDTTIEEFMKDSPALQELVDRCNGQYHVFNNNMKDRSQVTELLRKIRHVVKRNGGSHYTNDMFKRAERAIEAEKQRILKEKAEQIHRETEELERRLRAKYDEKLRSFMEKLEDELEDDKKKTQEWRRDEEKAREELGRDKGFKMVKQHDRKPQEEEKRPTEVKEMKEKEKECQRKEERARGEEKMEVLKTKESDRDMMKRQSEGSKSGRDERPKEGLGGRAVREREKMEAGKTKERRGRDREHERRVQTQVHELHENHKHQARQEAENNNPALMLFKTITKGIFGNIRK